jgi:dienelactone hydrolase
MAGWHQETNILLCRKMDGEAQDCFVDYSTQRQNLHACPAGTYMRGNHSGKNAITCCFNPNRGFELFEPGSETIDLDSQDRSADPPLHACPGGKVMTGLQADGNRFLCASPKFSTIANSLAAPEDVQAPRHAPLDGDAKQWKLWQATTRNWLLRILNVNPAGSSPTSPQYPAAPRFSVESAEHLPSGVTRELIGYPSPVDGVKEKAYLLLPKEYSPAGSYIGILLTHGHGDTKAAAAVDENSDNHAVALHLAEHGAIVLAPDTRSFGEYIGEHDSYKASVGIGTMPQQYLLDNLVRVSLLEKFPGVDKRRIESAGLSLGGYQAMWLSALDTRISRTLIAGIFLAFDCLDSPARHCYCQTVPAISRDFEAISASSAVERDSLFRTLTVRKESLLIDAADLAALIAPRPLRAIWGQEDNFFKAEPNRTCMESADRDTRSVYGKFANPADYQHMETPNMKHEVDVAKAIDFLIR